MTDVPASKTRGSRQRPAISVAQDLALFALYAAFLGVYVLQVADGRWIAVPFTLEQGILVGIFLTRRRATTTSTRFFDWLVAAGSFLPLLTRPTAGLGQGMEWSGLGVQTLGLMMTCAGFLYLGRSFGIVAANRGLKLTGPYRFVRHPIYLSHTVTLAGVLIAYGGWLNIALCSVATLCQIYRMDAEERVLSQTPEYASYRARVRWRLIPGLY